MKEEYVFKNRTEAGILLTKELINRRIRPDIIMALPRGGVPVGVQISNFFGIPLYLFLARKIGHPTNEEYAIGAVTEKGVILSNVENIDQEYIKKQISKERKRIAEMKKMFFQAWDQKDCQSKHIVIVDDGIATGLCMQLTIDEIKKMKPNRISIAVPVCPERAIRHLEKQIDDMISLVTPTTFIGIGAFYDDFSQLTDREVVKLLTFTAKADESRKSTFHNGGRQGHDSTQDPFVHHGPTKGNG